MSSIITRRKKRFLLQNKSAFNAILTTEGQLNRAFDFLIGRKHSQNVGQVKVSFRQLKAQIYWPTTDQKVRGSNPCGRTRVHPNKKGEP